MTHFLGNSFPAVVNAIIRVFFGIRRRDQYVKVGSSSIDELLFATFDLLDDPGRGIKMGGGTPHAMN